MIKQIFGKIHNVRKESELNCKAEAKEELLEEVSECIYLGSALCKNYTMDGEIREDIQGRRAIGELGSIIKNRNMSTEVQRELRKSIILPTLTYGNETWKWESEQFKVRAVETNYLRDVELLDCNE